MKVIKLVEASDYSRRVYGIVFEGSNVHEIAGQSQNRYHPHRVKVWSNTNRPNPHPGEVKWNNFGSIGGDGKYLDPSNKATDAELSFTVGAEASVISAHGDGTGTVVGGQVWGEELAVGDVVMLECPDGAQYGPFEIEFHRFYGLSLK